MITLFVCGKTRVINDRYITYQTESSFHATYRGYRIEINEQEGGGWYATVTHPDGGKIVDGYYTDHRGWDTMVQVIENCLYNILIP